MFDPTIRADVVIVGAGSAGCVLAERLSRDPRRRVTLLERGPWGRVDAGLDSLPIGAGATHARGYRTADPALPIVRGQGLGGSSAVNGGYFMRWHDADLRALLDVGPWSATEIERAYDELDAPGGTMRVSPWRDDELTDTAAAFERYWGARVPSRGVEERTPIVGLNRVLSNHAGRQRLSAFDGYLDSAADRENLAIVTGAEVARLELDDAGVRGVEVALANERLSLGAREVILCGGTLGTAQVLFASGIVTGGLPLTEHREVLVGYRRRSAQPLPPAVLQSVVHTHDGVEIRCYSDDFARFIDGVPAGAATIGVAAMSPGVSGSLTWPGAELAIDLGRAHPSEWPGADAVTRGVEQVVAMLNSDEFASIVEPGSIAVSDNPATSQHACASLPIGTPVGVDGRGGFHGVDGLRVVDGSILPYAGRSGPHETIMMLAALIGDDLIR